CSSAHGRRRRGRRGDGEREAAGSGEGFDSGFWVVAEVRLVVFFRRIPARRRKGWSTTLRLVFGQRRGREEEDGWFCRKLWRWFLVGRGRSRWCCCLAVVNGDYGGGRR
ncbi:hypothetical protein HAX54_011116, partial [Datura stramonium]|nr:hypothetical protein [Datura stramonium]